MSKHILQWNQFQNNASYPILNDMQLHWAIFEELIASNIPTDTMTQPTSVPITIPASTTAASTSLSHVHINRAFTPSTGHPKQYKYR
eukprot:10238541-Ditylum_brightwellii.AAC.1